MARRAQVRQKRPLKPDPVFNSDVVSRFINKMMEGGGKSTSERIFTKAMQIMQEKTKQDALTVFTKAMENCKPLLEVRPRRVGGATYQVPSEVRPSRSEALAMRWILQFAREKKGKPMHERLATELLDAFKGAGNAVKKREDTHKMAEANKAFAHYRW